MARLTAQDIRNLTPEERERRLEDLYDQLSSLRTEVATGGGTENPYQIRQVKKTIARILTVEREEELGVPR
ncbi:MAG: 50S ribosomal protein L29 [Candidatus Thorarchaeota archaeon]|jgi:large subunit ribosomal protein L29|nr:50S ribosomal protein L29 [Candidatus Thorarchaeota archaeon]